MSEARHTPGPWTVGFRSLLVSADGMRICDIRGWGHLTGAGALNLPEEEAVAIQTANAQLIAAAPDLLDALEAMLHTELVTKPNNLDEFEIRADVLEQAREAIRKAKGAALDDLGLTITEKETG